VSTYFPGGHDGKRESAAKFAIPCGSEGTDSGGVCGAAMLGLVVIEVFSGLRSVVVNEPQTGTYDGHLTGGSTGFSPGDDRCSLSPSPVHHARGQHQPHG
jgi:hypothetical protein